MVARPVPVWCGTMISAVIAERNIEEVNKPAICARRKNNQLSAGSSIDSIQSAWQKGKKKRRKKGALSEEEKRKTNAKAKSTHFHARCDAPLRANTRNHHTDSSFPPAAPFSSSSSSHYDSSTIIADV